jgi:hypothetical protein
MFEGRGAQLADTVPVPPNPRYVPPKLFVFHLQ